MLIVFKIRQDIFFLHTFFCALMNKCVPFHSPSRPQLCQIVFLIPTQVGYSGQDRNKIEAAPSKTKREKKTKKAVGGCGIQWKPVSRRYEHALDVLTAGGGSAASVPVSFGNTCRWTITFTFRCSCRRRRMLRVCEKDARARLPYIDK